MARLVRATLAAVAVFLMLLIVTQTDPRTLLPQLPIADPAPLLIDLDIPRLPVPPAEMDEVPPADPTPLITMPTIPPTQRATATRTPTRVANPNRLTGVLPVLSDLVPVATPNPNLRSITVPAAQGGSYNPAVGRVGPRIDAATGPAPPARIRIPRIAADAPIVPVSLAATQQIGVTDDAATIGWYGPPPGGSGVALLAGHRDWAGAKGSFYGLSDLRPGDTIDVTTQNGQTVTFVVWQSERYPTSAAPSGEILRTTGPPSLVLVSCEGSFDTIKHDYSHRRVVLAVAQSYLSR